MKITLVNGMVLVGNYWPGIKSLMTRGKGDEKEYSP
jgi:hypothetical protein